MINPIHTDHIIGRSKVLVRATEALEIIERLTFLERIVIPLLTEQRYRWRLAYLTGRCHAMLARASCLPARELERRSRHPLSSVIGGINGSSLKPICVSSLPHFFARSCTNSTYNSHTFTIDMHSFFCYTVVA
jgi:hypothetical protein